MEKGGRRKERKKRKERGEGGRKLGIDKERK